MQTSTTLLFKGNTKKTKGGNFTIECSNIHSTDRVIQLAFYPSRKEYSFFYHDDGFPINSRFTIAVFRLKASKKNLIEFGVETLKKFNYPTTQTGFREDDPNHDAALIAAHG